MRHQTVFRAVLLGLCFFVGQAAKAQVLVRLNEFLANNQSYPNASGDATDMLELYNTGATPVDLGGCSLSDSNIFPRRFVFPPGSVIAGNGFYRLIFATGAGSNATTVPFGISASGGFLYFYGPATNLIDQVEYGIQATDYSFGRVADGTGPWVLCTPTFSGATGNQQVQLGLRAMLRINEWRTKGSGKDWLEIFNPTNRPIDIGNCYLSDTVSTPTKFRIAANSFIGTGPMGGFLRLSDGGNSAPKYPADEWGGFGYGDNEQVVLTDTNAVTNIDFIPAYGTQTDDISQGRLPDGTTNIASFPKINDYDTASPAAPNFLLFTNLYINELLAHTDPPLEDAIEFINQGTAPVNISGWWLSNARNNRRKYRIPTGPALPVGGFRVIYEGFGTASGFNGVGSNVVEAFTFNSSQGDQAVLAQVDANGNLTGYIAFEDFESSANGISFGHYNTSVANDYKFVALSERTFGVDDPNTVQEFRQGTGKTNAYPKVGPLVINEIMFAPSNTIYTNINGVPTSGQNPFEEFIELRNITSQTVPLYDPQYPTNHWKLQKGVDFIFPLTNLAPNQFCLVVAFDPYTNAPALANFRSRFGVSNDIPIFGPWIGALDNAGDSIELYRPDPVQLPPHPDAGYVPYIRIDKVNYKSDPQNNWQLLAATTTGRTLQRKNSLLFGNDPINWGPDNPTAGRATSSALADSDGDGMPDQWEMDYGLNKNNPADAGTDNDGDSVSNLGEYVSGSNPTNRNSVLRFQVIENFEGTNKAVRFLAYSNATYTVQYRNSLQPDVDWNRLANVPASNERVVTVTDTNAWKKDDRYYRVVAPATQ